MVVKLGRELQAIEEAVGIADEAGDTLRVNQLGDRLTEIESEISGLVAQNLEGVYWQGQILKGCVFEVERNGLRCQCFEDVVRNIATGLRLRYTRA